MKLNLYPKNRLILLTILVLVAVSLSCNLPRDNNPQGQDPGTLVQDYQPSTSPASLPENPLSEAQNSELASRGYPDRFVILFFNETLFDDSLVNFRQESWYYDSEGIEIVFRNGDKFTEIAGNPIVAVESGKTAFRPEQFLAGMSLDQMLAATGDTGYYQEPVNSTLIPNGTLVFVQGLATGFEGGRLVYVEALPLGPAGDPANHP